MMIYELFPLCSFEIMLDFCSALFKALGRSDFLKNMVLKSALNLNIWKTSVKVNPYGRSGSSLILAWLGPRHFINLPKYVCVSVHTQSCMYPLWWKSIMLVFVFVILSSERTWSISSEFLGWAGFIFLAVTKPQKGKAKQFLTIKKYLEK